MGHVFAHLMVSALWFHYACQILNKNYENLSFNELFRDNSLIFHLIISV